MAASQGPNLGIWSGWIPGESGWSAHMDANLRLLDAVVYFTSAVAPTNTPPGSPAAGDRYILDTAPTGAWSGHAKALAVYDVDEFGTGAWEFFGAEQGWTALVLDADPAVLPKTWMFRGGSWAVKSEVASVFGQTGDIGASLDATPGIVIWDGTTLARGHLSDRLVLSDGTLDFPALGDGVVKSVSGTLTAVSSLLFSDLPAEVSFMPLAIFHPGPLDDGERIISWAADQDVLIPADFAGTRLIFDDPAGLPTANVTIDVQTYDTGAWTSIGSIEVDTAGSISVLASPTADLPLNDGQGYRWSGPASRDATFGDFDLTVRLRRASVSDIIVSAGNNYIFCDLAWGGGSSANFGTYNIEPDSETATHVTKAVYDNGAAGGTLVVAVQINGAAMTWYGGTLGALTQFTIEAPGTIFAMATGDNAVGLGDNVKVEIISVSGLVNDGAVLKISGTADS